MMPTEGKSPGFTAEDEREHFIRCTICGELFDMRDLGQVLDHLHGEQIPEQPTQH
ncbi:hypothetical protein [Bradyrhizobium sp. WYCCWR 12699]|uniref:hypothetical protein n=1 Tax=Bradyrhizobium sp. WYCCWR 12699 TaxID=3064203 RepID=UPI0028AF32E4|nr:hypothetical protein [Bradyrhizobium sp. WYCCWR 12699]